MAQVSHQIITKK